MYPTIEFLGITVYTFGTLLSIAWLLFFVLLHRFSWKKGFTKPIFSSIVPFTLSLFFFSRIFYIFSEWVEEKYVLMELAYGHIFSFLRLFFIPQDYHFSLFGAIFGFGLVFMILTSKNKKERPAYLDVIAHAFLWSALLGYFAALLGGQIYGIAWSSPVSLIYDHKNSIVTARSALFPLPIVYMILCGGILFALSKVTKHGHLPDGYIGSLGLGLFGVTIFLFDFLSGNRKDIFYDYFSLGMNQIGGLILVLIAVLAILRITGKKI